MATVEIAGAAAEDLERLIVTLSLPSETRRRVAHVLRALERFPTIGPPLPSRWTGYRVLLGPWRWLLLVYVVDEAEDRVVVVTMRDARASNAATSA